MTTIAVTVESRCGVQPPRRSNRPGQQRPATILQATPVRERDVLSLARSVPRHHQREQRRLERDRRDPRRRLPHRRAKRTRGPVRQRERIPPSTRNLTARASQPRASWSNPGHPASRRFPSDTRSGCGCDYRSGARLVDRSVATNSVGLCAPMQDVLIGIRVSYGD